MKERRNGSVIERIADGFLELLTKKQFIEITVSEIVEKAQVARASFYRNFSSTSDVLEYVVDDIVNKIYEIIRPALDNDDKRKWREFIFRFIYLVNESENYYTLLRSQNTSLLLNRFIETATVLVPDKQSGSMNDKYDLIARFSMICGVLIRWKDTGMKETPEEIVDYLMDFPLIGNA